MCAKKWTVWTDGCLPCRSIVASEPDAPADGGVTAGQMGLRGSVENSTSVNPLLIFLIRNHRVFYIVCCRKIECVKLFL
ncbi:hypothetical protein DXB15_16540 [Roseburia sp. OM02-15]|nr:hypothetical protein DXB15_16540 [Roseburia sp. OM02-15]